MRLVKTTSLAATLALAACSNGPSQTQIETAEQGMKTCVLGAPAGVFPTHAPTLKNIQIAPASLAAKSSDFTVSGDLPSFKGKGVFKKKSIDADYNVGITFANVAGAGTASLTGARDSLPYGGMNAVIMTPEPLDINKPYQGINLKVVLDGLKTCSDARQVALNPK